MESGYPAAGGPGSALERGDLKTELGMAEEPFSREEMVMIWPCFEQKEIEYLPLEQEEQSLNRLTETGESLAAWDQPKFSLKQIILVVGILELLLLVSMSCSTFLLVNWFSKKQDAITGGILVFLLLLLLSSYIYLTVVWKKPNFGKKYFAFIVGFFVFLLLVLISGIVFHLVSKAKPKECLPAAVPCPIPWTGYGEKCYFFSATEANWTHSQNHCTSQGGSLVTMETLEERDFIKRHRDRIGYWIGLWREGLSQSWMQPDGSLFDQTFPIKGEGLCAYLNGPVFSSTWCTNTRFWICSKPVT